MFGAFAPYEMPDEEFFPLDALVLSFRREDKIGHRDILGSLMGLSVKRETLGDIFVGEGFATVFVQRPIGAFLAQELSRVGRVGVRCMLLPAQRAKVVAPRFLDLEGTVSSLRLDCVVAFLTHQSRARAQELIRMGLVTKNALPMLREDALISISDRIAVRGYGKFLIDDLPGATRKERMRIKCKKYL